MTTATDAALVWNPESEVVGMVSVVGSEEEVAPLTELEAEGVAVTVTFRMVVSVCGEGVLASRLGSGLAGGKKRRDEMVWRQGAGGTEFDRRTETNADEVSSACELAPPALPPPPLDAVAVGEGELAVEVP